MSEFSRIARYFKPLAGACPEALGLGDDAALLQVPQGSELVVTTDAMVENTHFRLTDTPQSIAQRLLRSNLSDLAAMGAEPYGYTLIFSAPQTLGESWLAAFSETLQEDQVRFGCTLIGGDSVRTQGPLTLAITAFGLVPKGQALRRTLKRPLEHVASYDVYVTETVGDSALGLMLAEGHALTGLSVADEAFLKKRHYEPQPRLDVAQTIRPFALAAIDISDGLVADCGHIAAQSGLEVTLESSRIPLSPSARKALQANPALFETLITGGEDYELAFVIDPREEGLLSIAAQKLSTRLTKIGCIHKGNPGDIQVLDEAGRVIPLNRKGWEHF